MTRRDLNNEISVVSTLAPSVVKTTTAGTSVDLAQFTRAAFVAHVGVVTDGTLAFDPEESDDNSAWSNIAEGDLSGAFISATSGADETIQEVGYLGNKRYIRCSLTVTGSPATGGVIGIAVVRAGARTLPV